MCEILQRFIDALATAPLLHSCQTDLVQASHTIIDFHSGLMFLQEVLTQLTSRLASQLNDLTIQVVKEDWTLTSATSPIGGVSYPHIDPLPNTGAQQPKATVAAGLLPGSQTTSEPLKVPHPHPQACISPDHVPQVGHQHVISTDHKHHQTAPQVI